MQSTGPWKNFINNPWWSNTKANVSSISPEERLFSESPGCLEKRLLLRPEQRSVEWMMDLVSKFCKAGGPVLATCASTSATAKAYLQPPEHRRFVGLSSTLLDFKMRLYR